MTHPALKGGVSHAFEKKQFGLKAEVFDLDWLINLQ
jgi:hypothetical protein